MNVASLTEGVLRTMFWNKVKFVASFVLASVVLTTGFVGLLAAKDEKPTKPPVADSPARRGSCAPGLGHGSGPGLRLQVRHSE